MGILSVAAEAVMLSQVCGVLSMLLHGLLVGRADRIASTPTHLRSPSEPAWHMLLVPAAKGASIIAESVQLIGTC
jgi:hypothetical protein